MLQLIGALNMPDGRKSTGTVNDVQKPFPYDLKAK